MHGHEVLEGLAAIVLVGSGALFLPAAWVARRRALAIPGLQGRPPRDAVPSPGYASRATGVAAGSLALGAALIHLAVGLQFALDNLAYGIARAATTLVLLVIFAAALGGRLDRVRGPAVIGTLGTIGAWAGARATGLQLGEPWSHEATAVAELAAILLQLTLAVMLVGLGPVLGRTIGRRISVGADVMSVAVIPLVGAAGIVTLVALASLGGPSQPHAPHSPAPLAVSFDELS